MQGAFDNDVTSGFESMDTSFEQTVENERRSDENASADDTKEEEEATRDDTNVEPQQQQHPVLTKQQSEEYDPFEPTADSEENTPRMALSQEEPTVVTSSSPPAPQVEAAVIASDDYDPFNPTDDASESNSTANIVTEDLPRDTSVDDVESTRQALRTSPTPAHQPAPCNVVQTPQSEAISNAVPVSEPMTSTSAAEILPEVAPEAGSSNSVILLNSSIESGSHFEKRSTF